MKTTTIILLVIMAAGVIAALVIMRRRAQDVAVLNSDGSISKMPADKAAQDNAAYAAISKRIPGTYVFSDGHTENCTKFRGTFRCR